MTEELYDYPVAFIYSEFGYETIEIVIAGGLSDKPD